MNLLRLFLTPQTIPTLPKNNKVELDDDWYDCDNVDNSLQTSAFLQKEEKELCSDSIEILEELEELEEIEQSVLRDSVLTTESIEILEEHLSKESESEKITMESLNKNSQTQNESTSCVFNESNLIADELDLTLEDEKYLIHIKDIDIFEVLLKEMNELIDAVF
jgi:hypothetical protein